MPAVPRQVACNACADSKRRCDKQLPECQRCLDRDVDCQYPTKSRRHRKHRNTRGIGSHNNLPLSPQQAGSDVTNLKNRPALGYWDTIDAPVTDFLLPDEATLTVMHSTTPTTSEEVLPGSPLSTGIPITSTPWFLRSETWIRDKDHQDAECTTYAQLEPFIHSVEDMLKSWVTKGYNGFIHWKLYEDKMPRSIQDAFTTATAYIHRTPAVSETVLQIAEERSSSLVGQAAPISSGSRGIREHLIRVQALFVYEFIGLFDGSIRHRACAEQRLPTLRQWAADMWEMVRQHEEYRGFVDSYIVKMTSGDLDRKFSAGSDMWQLWILTESVRRTHIIVDTVCNIYEIMVKGWAECTGTVMVTALKGMWEAESVAKWVELSCTERPLLVPSFQPGALIAQYPAEEFDEFVKTLWTFIVGHEKMHFWVESSK